MPSGIKTLLNDHLNFHMSPSLIWRVYWLKSWCVCVCVLLLLHHIFLITAPPCRCSAREQNTFPISCCLMLYLPCMMLIGQCLKWILDTITYLSVTMSIISKKSRRPYCTFHNAYLVSKLLFILYFHKSNACLLLRTRATFTRSLSCCLASRLTKCFIQIQL